MLIQRSAFSVLVLAAIALLSNAHAEDSQREASAPAMSPELRTLLQAEMRQLLSGTQVIAAAIPTAEWDAIASTATTMRDSYILEKELTKSQKEELLRLPADFLSLDQSFHARTEKLAQAAISRDAEAVSFQFSRLLETCVACHASYAKARFPQFGASPDEQHHAGGEP